MDASILKPDYHSGSITNLMSSLIGAFVAHNNLQ